MFQSRSEIFPVFDNWMSALSPKIAVVLLVANVIVITAYNRYVERKYAAVFD